MIFRGVLGSLEWFLLSVLIGFYRVNVSGRFCYEYVWLLFLWFFLIFVVFVVGVCLGLKLEDRV